MAVVTHLIEHCVEDGESGLNARDGVEAIILAVEAGTDNTDAKVRTRGETVCNAEGYELPPGYFTANRPIAATWNAAGDVTVISGKKVTETIA